MLVLQPRPILFAQILQRRYPTHRITAENLALRQHFIRELLRRCIPEPDPFLAADDRCHEYHRSPPTAAILQLPAGRIPCRSRALGSRTQRDRERYVTSTIT